MSAATGTRPRSRRFAPRPRPAGFQLLAFGGLEAVEQVVLHPVHHSETLSITAIPFFETLDEVSAAILGIAPRVA